MELTISLSPSRLAKKGLGAEFWMYHLFLPLLFVAPLLYLFEHSYIDVAIADYWYQLEGGQWLLRKNWFTYDVMHHWGKRLILLVGFSFTALYAASWKVKKLRQWRWSFGFAFFGMAVLPATIAFLKHLSNAPCPWELSRYGGDVVYVHSMQYTSAMQAGHCFPAGHSSGGFGLLAIYFAFWPLVSKKTRFWLLLPGLLTGMAFGLAQQIRGAHFISHDLWSASIVWFGALLLFSLAWHFKKPL